MVNMLIQFDGHWWIHLHVNLNLRQIRFAFVIISVIVFEFEFDLYKNCIDHFERCVLVPCYHACQVTFANLESIVF